MSMSSTPSGSSTQTTQTQLPNWINNWGMTDETAAFNTAQNMLGPYQGATYAGLTDGANADVAGLQSLVGKNQPASNLAQNTAANLTGYQAPTVNAGSIASTDLNPYLNPYTQNVIGSAMQSMAAQNQQQINQNNATAAQNKALGGSRNAITNAATNAATNLGAGQLAAQLQQQNFQQAQQAAGQDVATNLQGQLANQNAYNSGAGLQLQAASQLGGLGSQQQSDQLAALQAALQGNVLEQQNNQGQLTADQNAYTAAQQFPVQQLQLLLGTLQGTPYGSTSTTTGQTSAPGNSTMAGISGGLGILGSIGSIAGAFS